MASLLVKPETTTDDLSLPGKAPFSRRLQSLHAEEISQTAFILLISGCQCCNFADPMKVKTFLQYKGSLITASGLCITHSC